MSTNDATGELCWTLKHYLSHDIIFHVQLWLIYGVITNNTTDSSWRQPHGDATGKVVEVFLLLHLHFVALS